MKSRSFTLTEVLVVIAIIVILAGILIGGVGFAGRKADSAKAQASIQLLSAALEKFHSERGFYPPCTSAQDVQFLLNSDENLKLQLGSNTYNFFDRNSQKDFLELEGLSTSATTYDDSWGNAFQYKCPGDHNRSAFDLWSKGPDGSKEPAEQTSDDDITNWDTAL